ncbi:MAG TPA: hypothetical protein PK431_08280 [Chitinophagales bacterium]|jgi:hypothetical protein|nr:hypothetical protein [Chitinophagales bacterium]
MPLLRTKFNKDFLLNALRDIPFSPYKNTFVEKFIQITDNWFAKKLYLINEVLPSGYHGIEVHSFITLEDVRQLVGNGHYQYELSVKTITVQLQTMLHEIICNSLSKGDLQTVYDVENGTIYITYTL